MNFYSYNITTSIDGDALSLQGRRRSIVVNCLNPHSFICAEQDSIFKEALQHSDLLLPDGIGICNALHHWKGEKVSKIAGDDFHSALLKQLDKTQGKVFYLGSTPEVLAKIEQRLKREHPQITCKCLSPSFCKEFSEEENANIIQSINEFAPDALLIGMTAPKQEKWVYKNLVRFDTPMVIGSIGAVFEFYAGTKKRAHPLFIRMRLEWLVRLLQDPKHLWRRNFVSAPKFILYNIQHHKSI